MVFFMRIAIFTETYLPYINGVVTHIKILRDGLVAMGHEVLIVTADKNTAEHKVIDGVLRCPALEFKKLYGYGVASPLSMTLKSKVSAFNPDIIHIQQEFGTGLAGIRISRDLGIPLIYTLHTMYDDYIYYIAPFGFGDLVKRISHQYIRFVARRADIITGPSKKCADYLHNAGVRRKVYVIPNSVEVENYTEESTTVAQRLAVREKYGIPADAFVGCFCGRIGKEKGIDHLIRLWAATTDDHMYLLIIGNGPYREQFEELAKECGIGHRVKFTGAVSHEQLAPYYACCDCYATASLSEMYSISMLEAQASGLPVLQRLDPDNVDQIKEGVNGYLFETEGEFGRLVNMLAAMSADEKANMRQKVRESVAERSSVGIAKYLLELYNLAIERRRGGICPKALKSEE